MREKLRWAYRGCGRVIAMAMIRGYLITEALAEFFLRGLQEPDVVFDLAALDKVDSQLARHYRTMLNEDLGELGLEEQGLRFQRTLSSSKEALGDAVEVDLVPCGAEKAVLETNKEEWVAAAIQHKLADSIRPARDAFREGVLDVLPEALLQLFTPEETRLHMSGSSVEDLPPDARKRLLTTWRDCTSYIGCDEKSPEVCWLWEILEEGAISAGELLKFTTGSSRLSYAGIHGLDPLFCVTRVTTRGDAHLPEASTCSNELRWPVYSSKEAARIQLQRALELGCAGFGNA